MAMSSGNSSADVCSGADDAYRDWFYPIPTLGSLVSPVPLMTFGYPRHDRSSCGRPEGACMDLALLR
jgi:hypothetical protein